MEEVNQIWYHQQVIFNDQDVIIENDDEKAQTFCEYFSSVFTNESLANIPNISAKSCFHYNKSVLFLRESNFGQTKQVELYKISRTYLMLYIQEFYMN